MKKIMIALSLMMAISSVNAQNASDKTISEICTCVKKIDAKLTEDEKMEKAFTCMSNGVEKNIEALKKEYNVKSENLEQASQEIGAKVGIKLVQGCPDILPYLMNYAKKQEKNAVETPDINPDTLKLDSKVCDQFKAGKIKSEKNYMNKKLFPSQDASSYSEIKDGFIYDYSGNKQYTTKWSIRWINSCEWEQTLVETNEPNLKLVLKKGDKVVMKAIGSTKSGSLWVSSRFMGLDLLVLMSKVK